MVVGGFLMWTMLLAIRELESACNLKPPTRERVEQAIRLDFPASNNETEYEAILAGVDLAQSVSSEKILIRSDS